MSNCGTCKFWAAKDDQPKEPQPSIRDFAKCLRVADGADFETDFRDEIAYTASQSVSRLSLLLTKADFGCVLWEGVK